MHGESIRDSKYEKIINIDNISLIRIVNLSENLINNIYLLLF